MKTFLQAVASLHLDNYERMIEKLSAEKTPCGLFFLGKDAFLSDYLRFLAGQGVRVTLVVTLGSELPSSPVPVIHALEFPAWQEKPQLMFFDHEGIENCFAVFFARYGIESVFVSGQVNIRERLDAYDRHILDLYEAYADFRDEASRRAYLGVLRYWVTARLSAFDFAPEPQYFLDGYTVQPGDIAIDGGAYDGATAHAFAAVANAQGGHVYAFEMDEQNFGPCAAAAERYGFTAENYGLAKTPHEERYRRADTGSHRDAQGDCVARFTSIDAYAEAHGLPRVDFIKMDIEGAELDALHGAAHTILRWKPRMAICAYHKPEDLWVLQRYLRSLRPDYAFAFRHYPIDVHAYVFTDAMRDALDHFQLPHIQPTRFEYVLYCR